MQIFINLSVVNWTPELGRNQVADQVTEGLMHRGGTPPPPKKNQNVNTLRIVVTSEIGRKISKLWPYHSYSQQFTDPTVGGELVFPMSRIKIPVTKVSTKYSIVKLKTLYEMNGVFPFL